MGNEEKKNFIPEIKKTLYCFRTKTGLCTIDDEKISIERSGLRGGLAQKVIGNTVKRPLIFYSITGFLMVFSGIILILEHDYIFAGILLIFGIYFLVGVIRSRNFSATPILYRSDIVKIKSRAPIPLLTGGFFKVSFKEEGKLKHRAIILPGSFEEGKSEFIKARQYFIDSGLM